MSTDLHTDTRLILETAQHVEGIAYDYEPPTDPLLLEPDLIAWAMLEEANRALSAARSELAKRLAGSFPKGEKRVVVEGAGVFESHRKTDRKKWDRDELLRVVLDTRRFDTDTGADISDLDKVLFVWSLGAPRVTALRELDIDPDEYAEVERGGLTLQFTGEAVSAAQAA